MSGGLQLVMSQGPSPGRAFTIDQPSSTLGRDPTNQIVIDEPQVSRLHARVVLREGVLVIEDMGSTNGTFVNGVRLTEPLPLAPGDVVGLGESVTLTLYSDVPASAGAAGGYAPHLQEPLHDAAAPAPPPPAPVGPRPPTAWPGPDRGRPTAAPAQLDDSDREDGDGSTKRRQYFYLGCGCLALLLTCAAVSLFLWYAPASFWDFVIGLGIPIPPNPF